MKAIITTQYAPSHKKRTIGTITVNGKSYMNISAYLDKETNPKGLVAVGIEDLPILNITEIYSPKEGYGTTYFGGAWAYECTLPDNFSLKQKYLKECITSFVDDRKKIGDKIKKFRIESGLTQEQLAEMTGLKKQNISRIEIGKYSTGQDILSAIAKALGKRLDII